MDKHMVEVYRHLRDNAKPYTQQDAADLAKVRTFTPPSRALLKLHRRVAHGLPPHPEAQPREYAPKSAEVLQSERQREFHKRVIQQLGGSLTIARPPEYERPPIEYIHSRDGPIEHRSEREKYIEEGKRLAREAIRASDKMVYTDHQPDMFDVLEAWGSFKAYAQEFKQ